MSIRVIIIEDEEPARSLIKNYLKNFVEIELVGECSDGFSGVKAINELKPDLVFLDIQMPRLTGFEVLELVEHTPVVIFATAFDNFAIKAFEANAIDYLLKPYSRERFAIAVTKAITIISKPSIISKSLLGNQISTDEIIDRVAVKQNNQIHIIQVNDIIYIQAEGDYVMLYTKTSKYLKEKTMKYFETHLNLKQFIRIHRSSIVNISSIKKIDHYDKENYSALLNDGTVLKISLAGYKLLKELINL